MTSLNEAIANHIEPKESLPPLPDELVVGEDTMLGPVAWVAVMRYSEGDVVRWQHLDFVKDPAAEKLLRERLTKDGYHVTYTRVSVIVADYRSFEAPTLAECYARAFHLSYTEQG